MKTIEVVVFLCTATTTGLADAGRGLARSLDGTEFDGAFGYRWNNPSIRALHHILALIEVAMCVVFVAMLVTR
jgi:hypothetical protein